MTALAKKERAVYNQGDFKYRSELPVVAAEKKYEETVLLSTKLKMPRPRRDYVVRRSLFEKLKRCSEMGVVFVKGAAGMGKTTLLSSFIVETGLKNTAWLSLDETDNNMFPFWHYFAAAAGSLLGEKVGLSTSSPLLEMHDLKNYLVFLINRLCGGTNFYIVLDDFHFITNPALIDTLEFFLKSMPENLHLFLLSREDPPVYLGALAVSGKLLYLSGDEMKLSHEESIQFLKNTMKLKAGSAELEKMSSFAEGWVGGLQLAAAGGEFSGDLLKQGGGFAAEYLTREIFSKLSQEEQNFLICTGVLSWFSENICSGLFENLNFDSMLQDLLDKNLFVICIDEEKGIYRYHNILSEYLKQRFHELPSARQKEILCRAASGFDAAGDLDEAISLLLEAQDYDGAMTDIMKLDMTSRAGEYINKIPFERLVKNLDLAIRGVIYNIDCGDSAAFDELCVHIMHEWKDSPFCELINYARGMFSRTPFGREIPELIPLSQISKYHIRPETFALMLVGCSNLLIMDRRYALSEKFIDQARELAKDSVSTNYYAMECKAQLAEETGRLNDGLWIYAEIKKQCDKSGNAFMQEYDYTIGIAGIYMKRMELTKAKDVLVHAQEMLVGNSLPQNLISFSLDYNWAEYDMLSENEENGEKRIKQLIGLSDTQNWVDRLLIELCAADRMDQIEAEKILEEYQSFQKVSKQPSPAFELLCARIYFKLGNSKEAVETAEAVLTFSRENQNHLRLVEADLLLLQMTDDTVPAGKRKRNNLLREAIYYSWKNRIIQPFYIDRNAVNPLWKDFNASLSDQLDEEERQFVREVMQICMQERDSDEKSLLSSRELEVLAELAKGKTNPQIAEDLCISLSTVKTHVLNIFGKLDVSSRMNAVKEAKRIGLIP